MPTSLDQLIDRFVSHLLMEKNYSEHTAEAYSRDLISWLETAGVETLEEFGEREALEAVSEWTDELAQATLSRRVSTLRSFAEFLEKQGHQVEFVPEDLKIATGDELPETLTESEVERVIEAAEQVGGELGVRNRAILELLYSSGLRAGELVALEFTDLNESEQVLFIRSGKGDKDRVVPVGDVALEWIRKYAAEVRSGLPEAQKYSEIFLGRKGPLSRQQLYRIVREAGEKAEIGRIGVTPHTLRHSCATHMVENGADLVTVKQLLGHASIDTVQIYTRLSTDHLKRVYDQFHPLAESD